MTGKVLSKADIIAADDTKLRRLHVPEWGGDVFIRLMTGEDRDQYETWASQSKEKSVGIRGRLAAMCLVDEAGNRLFDFNEIEAVGKKSAAALERICTAITEANAITEADIEDLTKNSNAAPSDSSSSA